jgi:23S rRNA G2069 N7-methylase RlmK/C1962 C5-methylase RlmI
MFELDRSWKLREQLGVFSETEAVRVFHGPGEGGGALSCAAVDKFGDHFWITQWEPKKNKSVLDTEMKQALIDFYRSKGALSLVSLLRPNHGHSPAEPEVWFGAPPEVFWVRERDLRFQVRFQKTRHPGLFLDHTDLRIWLQNHVAGLRVLNTFAYTGSLSVAANRGRAKKVFTLDLSGSSLSWAKENLRENGFGEDINEIIAGDVFQWLPRLKKEGKKMDCIILDPPSFARTKTGHFSTTKDLVKLHSLALDVLEEGGFLVTSINSANVSWQDYERDLVEAAKLKNSRLLVLKLLYLPETFPTPLGQEATRYLKGWILQRI